MTRSRNIALVLAFVAVLVAPTVATIVRWNPMGGIDEKRTLATLPKDSLWSRGSLARVPAIAQAWEKYHGDHFGLRKLLIGSYRLAAFHVLHSSANPAVVVGKSDGERRWLYFDAGVTGDGVGLESVLGKKPYTPAQLVGIAQQLRQITELVRSKGAKLVIAVCPDKQAIYPEYLPADKRPRPGTVSRLDQFWGMAASLDGIPLVDLRIPLRGAKAQDQLYYPSDTHWNWRAGILAYQAIGKALEAQDPARGVLVVDRASWSLGPPRVGDLTALMGVPALGGDRDWLPGFADIAASAGPKRGKLLVLGDSFFELVQPFLAMQFETVKKTYLTRTIRTHISNALLNAEKPDVVIIQSLERYWTMD
jgi:alginate O-acetyltransferase complex protein AlgJ